MIFKNLEYFLLLLISMFLSLFHYSIIMFSINSTIASRMITIILIFLRVLIDCLLYGVEILFHDFTCVFDITVLVIHYMISIYNTTVLTHGPSMQGLSYFTLRGIPVSARAYTLYTSKVHPTFFTRAIYKLARHCILYHALLTWAYTVLRVLG